MSKIEWTGETWNPIVGCSVVSPGCTNCYAMRQADRIQKMNKTNPATGYVNHYDGTTKPSRAGPVFTGHVAVASDRVFRKPLGRKEPTTYFVNSMGDLFHENVPDEWIDRVFTVMALCPQHTFQVLTKRSERMRDYVAAAHDRVMDLVCDVGMDKPVAFSARPETDETAAALGKPVVRLYQWPLANVWLGVSAEDQTRADERIPDLLDTRAKVRFVSAEPLLGAIDFRLNNRGVPHNIWGLPLGPCGYYCSEKHGHVDHNVRLDWIIAGGESGPNARPMHPDWARSIREQCAASGVQFFFKQWGEWKPLDNPGRGSWPTDNSHAKRINTDGTTDDDGYPIQRVGKAFAGRVLDGRVHDDMPRLAHE